MFHFRQHAESAKFEKNQQKVVGISKIGKPFFHTALELEWASPLKFLLIRPSVIAWIKFSNKNCITRFFAGV